MKNLLLEIGTEELPAGYINPALKALSSLISNKLTTARIAHGDIKIYGTPKRVAVVILNIEEKQKVKTTKIVGPPEKIAFDDNGKPKVPAVKFAEKAGIPIDAIVIEETKKGRYVTAVVNEKTEDTKILLEKILPESILAIPFPKTMKWADLKVNFARPIISVTALFDTQVVPFTIGNIKADSFVFGHRFMNCEKIQIKDPLSYIDALKKANVYVSMDERRKLIENQINEKAKSINKIVLPDEKLLDTVVNLVEYPVAVIGKFDDEFLELPDEILITAMREHQKYFAVIDKSGKLMPYFIAVNNSNVKNMALVTNGHEKVLRARLADAVFFYKADLKEGLEKMVIKLDKLLFQAQLGSVYEKTDRIENLCKYLLDKIKNNNNNIQTDVQTNFQIDKTKELQILRAARLCKADLVSETVIEFTKLQGVMGRIYAQKSGEAEVTCTAIEEHYLPTYSGGLLPKTFAGSIVAIADKMDSICGCFAVGLLPTGASDPYALRRQGIGIIQIIKNMGFVFHLKEFIEYGVKNYNIKLKIADEDIIAISSKIYSFFKNRLEHILIEKGYSKDLICAVLDSEIDSLPDVLQRIKALENLKKTPDFESLVATFKRIINIIKKSQDSSERVVNQEYFQKNSEVELYNVYLKTSLIVKDEVTKGNYEKSFSYIAKLRSFVDNFFDDVMVMDEDKKIRKNRIALLGVISDLFINIADFTQIMVDGN